MLRVQGKGEAGYDASRITHPLHLFAPRHFCPPVLASERFNVLTLLFNARQATRTMAFSATIEDYDFVSIICPLPNAFSPFNLFNLFNSFNVSCGFAALPF
jgi:hypothetical protein